MKKIIVLSLFIGISFFAYSQDTVFVEGYFIRRYNTEDIQLELLRRVFKEAGKTIPLPVHNHHSTPFYFPLQVSAKIKPDTIETTEVILWEDGVRIPLWRSETIGDFLLSDLNFYKHTEVFFFAPFKGILPINLDLQTLFDSADFSTHDIEFPSPCSYYYLNGDEAYGYTIYYIEGYALRLKVENDYLNPKRFFEDGLLFEIRNRVRVDNSVPSFYVYLFYKTEVIRCDSPPEGFVELHLTFNLEQIERQIKRQIKRERRWRRFKF